MRICGNWDNQCIPAESWKGTPSYTPHQKKTLNTPNKKKTLDSRAPMTPIWVQSPHGVKMLLVGADIGLNIGEATATNNFLPIWGQGYP